MFSRQELLPFKECAGFSPTELAWMAGFIDGEGSIGVHYERKSGKGRLSVQVGNTHKPTMERICARWGRKMYADTGGKNGPRKTCWKTGWHGKNARELLILLLPYLVAKKRQAELGIEYLDTMTSAKRPVSADVVGHRGRIHDELKLLNKRGIVNG